jgi:hypothetical protein
MSWDSPGSSLPAFVLDSPPSSPIRFTSPPCERVRPTSRITFPESPTTASTGTPAKRRRKRHTHDADQQQPSRFHRESWEATCEMAGPADDSADLPATIPRSPLFTQVPKLTSDDSYLRYVDLVLADCAAFYQISATVYAVQGWDQKKQEPTVSLPTPSHDTLFSLIISFIGIICSESRLAPPGRLHVSAHWLLRQVHVSIIALLTITQSNTSQKTAQFSIVCLFSCLLYLYSHSCTRRQRRSYSLLTPAH